MAVKGLAKSVVRRARRLPGYRRLRRTVLYRLRTSDTAREVVARVFTDSPAATPHVPQPFPYPGNLVAGLGVDLLPVWIISMVGVPPERIEPAVREVARYQVLFAHFRPVFLLDQPEFAATRQFRYPTELLVHRSEWDFPDTTWLQYASRRLSQITRHYNAAAVVEIPPEGVTDAIRMVLGGRRR